MDFSTAANSARGLFKNRSRPNNVFHLAGETASSYFTSQWKLLELKRHLDDNSQAVASPALPFRL